VLKLRVGLDGLQQDSQSTGFEIPTIGLSGHELSFKSGRLAWHPPTSTMYVFEWPNAWREVVMLATGQVGSVKARFLWN
jgi:hypothetical protein